MMRNELGNAIRNARMEKKLTQEKLAELVNISPVHVKQIEAGTRMPSVEVLYKISVTLNLSVDDVFFPEEPSAKEMLGKIERVLRICTQHDLRVVYATACALTDTSTNES
jgi:transcriptional regulator with XRE-family HTH domain